MVNKRDTGDKKNVEIVFADKKCYLCDRTEKDLNVFQNALLNLYEQRINQAEEILRKSTTQMSEYLKSLLKDIDNITDLDFKIDTIKTDYQKFIKIIPILNDLLDLAKKWNMNDYNKLTDIKAHIQRWLNNPDDENIQSMKKQINQLKYEKDSIINNGYWKLTLNNYKIDRPFLDKEKFQEYKNSINEIKPVFMLFICPICSQMFLDASSAAYDIIHYDSDDD